MSNAILTGRIFKKKDDPGNGIDYRFTPSGQGLASFTFRMSSKKNKEEWNEPVYVGCTVWDEENNPLGQDVNENYKEGDYVKVDGKLYNDAWEKDGKVYRNLKMTVYKIEHVKESEDGVS